MKFNRTSNHLYVSDLDGTLLNKAGGLNPLTQQTVRDLHAGGIPFTVASGRTFSSIRAALGPLPLSLPIVSSDGALVSGYDHPRPLWTLPMDTEALKELVDDCLRAGLHPILDVWDGTDNFMGFTGVHNHGMEFFHGFKLKEDSYLPRIHSRLQDWFPHTVISLTVIDTQVALQAFRPHFDAKYAGIFKADGMEFPETPGWGALWLQHQDARKEVALEKVLDHLGWTPEAITVFGDEMNDYGMFRKWHGVAVENARPEVRAQAKEIIGPHFEDAVARYILGRMAV